MYIVTQLCPHSLIKYDLLNLKVPRPPVVKVTHRGRADSVKSNPTKWETWWRGLALYFIFEVCSQSSFSSQSVLFNLKWWALLCSTSWPFSSWVDRKNLCDICNLMSVLYSWRGCVSRCFRFVSADLSSLTSTQATSWLQPPINRSHSSKSFIRKHSKRRDSVWAGKKLS